MAWLSSLRANQKRASRKLGRGLRRLLSTLANRDESEGALGRHSVMLFSLIVLLVALPLGQAIFGEPMRFSVLLTFVLISAIVVNRRQRGIFLVASLIGVVSIAGISYAELFDSQLARVTGELLALGLLGFTTLVMFNSLIQASEVSQDTVIGGICVYLLVGLCFAMIFILMTDFDPGALTERGHAIVRAAADSSEHATTLLYFSFVTLTSLGYGDVAPVGDMARMFAVSEALIGQLYLAIFLARLVALYVVSVRRPSI
jgi:hypothetical protein